MGLGRGLGLRRGLGLGVGLGLAVGVGVEDAHLYPQLALVAGDGDGEGGPLRSALDLAC